jgi:hypothetical protein
VKPGAGDARASAGGHPALPGLPGGGLTDRPELTDELIDELLGGARTAQEIAGPDGLLGQLTRRLLERALEAEITKHVGYEHGHAPPGGTGNARNGRPAKTVLTDHGAVRIRSPRDRNGTFEPQIVAKRQTRWVGFDEKVIALYARGMTVRDIQIAPAAFRSPAICEKAPLVVARHRRYARQARVRLDRERIAAIEDREYVGARYSGTGTSDWLGLLRLRSSASFDCLFHFFSAALWTPVGTPCTRWGFFSVMVPALLVTKPHDTPPRYML